MDNVSNIVTAAVKTAVTGALTALFTWLANIGIDVGEHATVISSLALIFSLAAVNAGMNWLSKKWPAMAKVFSLGLAEGAPQYNG